VSELPEAPRGAARAVAAASLTWLAVAAAALGAGCGDESAPEGQGGSATVSGTGAGGDAGAAGGAGGALATGGAGGGSDVLAATDYCERAVDVFCPFYLRCGRIAENDLANCRSTFLESCEQNYEPRYAELAALGLLELSASGLEACASYLADVPCERHLLDLEEPCRDIWQGLAPDGAACGLGVESFVCDGETTCIIDTDLCGVCEPASDPGGSCGTERHCRYPSDCVGGVCVAAAFPGEACGDSQPCIAGASCEGALCVARTFVGVGESCDAARRCVYRSTCHGGTCSLDALLGEPCSAATSCATGACNGATGLCEPWLAEGESCGTPAVCLSGACEAGTCAALTSACVAPPG
jgi:hypothetical protein